VSYAFGDSERAARRLAQVARVFEPASSAFLADHGWADPGEGVALDLGCGPGYTTEMVARVVGCARCIGMDASEAYVASARERAPGCEFVRHDVLDTPWPTPAPELVYARFLISHLTDADAALEAFRSQLAPGGRLLLDEVEEIHSEAEPFQRYLSLVECVLASQGQCLYVGSRLGALADAAPSTRANEVRRHEVDPRDAATMFALNWETLRDHDAVAKRTTPAERDALATELAALRAGEDDLPRITWALRQVVLES
jgi:SAM-dependent methyltransferase